MTETQIAATKIQYAFLKTTFNERHWRLYLATEAKRLGDGHIALVARLSGASINLIRRGLADLDMPPLDEGRVRRSGGGRKGIIDTHPEIAKELETIIHKSGNPMKHVTWTHLSIEKITAKLKAVGHAIGESTVNRALWEAGYSLKKNQKELHKTSHPDRDAQFNYIDALADKYIAAGGMVTSIDAKKTEKIGNFKNDGQTYSKKGKATKVEDHDFGHQHKDGDQKGQIIKAIPFGIYDVRLNKGYINVGTDHNTSELAVESLRRWYNKEGKVAYPDAEDLMITADCGGANGNRVRQWKWELQQLASETGLAIHICHYPAGTSKWNKIEHKLFSFISQNWQGMPLQSYDIVLGFIGGTTTKTGLTVTAELDTGIYELRKRPSDEQMASMNLQLHEFHPEWNYTIRPQEC